MPKVIPWILICVAVACAAEIPEALVANGQIRARLYLPDAQHGYYRGTRFDWSGVIASLEYKGHNYFGKWFEKYDPKIHDAISGPVEEFRSSGAGLGYSAAKPGETFVKIGVGVLRKPDEPRYSSFNTYEIVDSGKWRTRTRPDRVEFEQTLQDSSGYGYLYKKTVRLVRGRPEMVIEHSLKNIGRQPIETNVYNHNFFVIDNQPSGPDFAITFPFDLQSTRDMNGIAEPRGKQLVYLKELEKGRSIITNLRGFGNSPSDYDVKVENAKTRAGVRFRGDRPLSDIVFWSIRTTLSPETYIEMRIEPGKQFNWRIAYEFYTLR